MTGGGARLGAPWRALAVALVAASSGCTVPGETERAAAGDTLAGFAVGEGRAQAEERAAGRGLGLACAPVPPDVRLPTEREVHEQCVPEGVERNAPGYFVLSLDDAGRVVRVYAPVHRAISQDSLWEELRATHGEPDHEDDLEGEGRVARWERGGAMRLLTCVGVERADQCALGVILR